MSVTITIGGTTYAIRNGSTMINEVANGKSTLDCIVDTTTGTFRPAIGQEIVVTENSTIIFGGIITEPAESSMTDSGAQNPYWQTTIHAEDYSLYATRRFVTGSRNTELLKTRLTWLINNYLDDYGVSMHPGQQDGPVLNPIVYEDRRTDDVLNELAVLSTTLSGTYMWQIDTSKRLLVELSSVLTAPFNVTDSDQNAIGDITVEPIQSDYANKIILRAGSGVHDVTDTFTGDGATSKFALTMPFVSNVFGFIYNNAVAETFAVQGTGFDNAVYWLYDPSDNTINRVAGAGPPANTNPISITYQAQFPIRIVSDAGAAAADVVERVLEEPDVFNKTTAQSLADAYLDIYNQQFSQIRYTTTQIGIHPGMSQTVTKANRNINSSCLVTEVTTRHIDGPHWIREVILTVGTVFSTHGGTWRDTIKQWNGSERSFGATGSGVTLVNAGSSFPQGYPIDVPYSAGNFTGNGAMTWTVDSGDQETFSYIILGSPAAATRTMIIWLRLLTTTVGGTVNNALRVTLPAGATVAKKAEGTFYYLDATTHGIGLWQASTVGDTFVEFYIFGWGNWTLSTNTTYILATIAIPIS